MTVPAGVVAPALCALALLGVSPAPGTAQGAAGGPESVEALAAAVVAGPAPVSFTVSLRPGVRVCRNGIRTGSTRVAWTPGRQADEGCSSEEAEVHVRAVDGRVREVVYRPAGSGGGGRSLGRVSETVAADYLLTLSSRNAATDAVEDGLVAATLFAGVDVRGHLVRLLEDRSLPTEIRKGVLFWSSQVVGESLVPEMAGIARDDGEPRKVRDAAVFALSQRPPEEAIPALLDLSDARLDPETLRSTLFWLSQFDDPRVVQRFRELLSSGG